MTGQHPFGAALLDPTAATPPGLTDPQGRPAGRRFDVYRNNVAVSLTQALQTGFPVIRKLVGAEFFDAMAGVFLRAHPPETPRLQLYGTRFPGFLAGFPPVAHLPYLRDIARLELGLRQSYHAADATPLNLHDTPPEAVLALAPRMAPATLTVVSRHPILSIWRRNTDPAAPKPGTGAETVLITRPAFDPAPHLLPPGGVALIRRLKGRTPLTQAIDAAQVEAPDADMPDILSLLLGSGALTLDTPAGETP